MSVNLSPVAGAAAQFLDNSGNVLTGGKLYTYLAGTTTPAATYTSFLGVTFHANPIILDASGRVPSGGEIWLSDNISYKFVLKDANEVLIATWDNLSGINSNFVNYTIQEEVQTATAGQTVFNLSTVTYAPGTNSLSVYVDGVNQYEGGTYSFVETNATTVTFTAGLHVGALVKFTTAVPATGTATNANVVTYDPAGTGAVATTVQSKLRETVSVKDYGAVGDGVSDDTAAIQAAVDAWLAGDVAKQLIISPGEYKITDVILCSPTVNIDEQKVLTGYGAKIVNQSATKAFRFITTINQNYWANAVIEGLTIEGGVDCFSFEAGGPANQDWMWQFTLKNLNAFNFTGNGFYFYDGFFESALYSCASWGLNTNTTGYGFKFENGPSSVISSVDVYNANTRYCKHGLYTVSPVVDVDIFGGTFLQAYEEGIRLGFSAGTLISGVHVENNFQSATGAIRAGIRYSGSATVSGVIGQSSDATKQNYVVNVFATSGSVINGGHIGGVGHTAFGYYNSAGGAADSIVSLGVTYTATTAARVMAFNGNGLQSPMFAYKSNFVAYAASVTPNLNLGTYFRVGPLTGNIIVNNPTFSGTVATGTTLLVVLTQDLVGGHGVTWGANFRVTTAIDTTIGSWNTWTLLWDGVQWREIAYAKT